MLDMTIRWKKRPTFHSYWAEKGHLLEDGCILSWFHSRSSTTTSSLVMCDLHFYFWRMTDMNLCRFSTLSYSWILQCTNDIKAQQAANKFYDQGQISYQKWKKILDIWMLTTFFTQLWEHFSSHLCSTVEKGAAVFWSGLGFSQLWLYE